MPLNEPVKNEVIADAPVEKPVFQNEASRLLREAQKIREQYGNNEGDIPVHSEYWGLMNQFRGAVK
jgi:hypothetical protein